MFWCEAHPDAEATGAQRRERGSIETNGIHGSTCVMNYEGATGWLIGERDKGMRAMFTMMNEARLGVGIQGLALSEVAAQNAAAYARDRRQGRALSGAKDKDSSADRIVVHPDIRRTLATMRGFNIAARALALQTALDADIAARSPDAKVREAAEDRIGLLTPVVKGVLTDLGFANAVVAQQVFGGAGYITETGVEQFVRDARIAMIYEGANGIQGLDLVGRKLPKDGGRAVRAWFPEVGDFLDEHEKSLGLLSRHQAGAGRSAGSHHVVRDTRHDEARQRRRRRHRLPALLRPGGARLYVVPDRGRRGSEDRRRRCGGRTPARRPPDRARLHGARDAGDDASPRPHRGGIGHAHEDTGRRVLMAEAFIYDHVRTPRGRGKKDGALHEVSTAVLAAGTLTAIAERNALDPAMIGDVILGCVDPVGEAGGDIARNAVFAAGFPNTVPGMQINRYCASGLDAVNLAHAAVSSGQHDMIVAGGVESMSRVGIGQAGNAWAIDPAVALPGYFVPQGVAADLIATKYGFSRTDVDAYAVESQKRAKVAWDEGRFAKSVVPVRDVNGLTILARDEHMRPDTSMQGLAALQPSFAVYGEWAGSTLSASGASGRRICRACVHHAGDSSGVVDSAAAVLVASKRAGKKAGLTPRARIRAWANIGSEPAIMLTGPVDVTKRLFERTGMSFADIDLIEVNEAFASVVLRYVQAFDLDPAKVNVNGGAIAMGHPLGATGAMLLGTAIDELERRDLNTALVTLCIGGGMGTATIVERV